jgi:hypothetical protein
MAEASAARLPDMTQATELTATVALRVISSTDVSQPTCKQRRINDGLPPRGGAGRLLRLQLTDGVVQCGAFEYRPLDPTLSVDVGATLLVKQGTLVARGMLLLEAEKVELVAAPPPHAAAEAHDAAATKGDGLPSAPKFTPLPVAPVHASRGGAAEPSRAIGAPSAASAAVTPCPRSLVEGGRTTQCGAAAAGQQTLSTAPPPGLQQQQQQQQQQQPLARAATPTSGQTRTRTGSKPASDASTTEAKPASGASTTEAPLPHRAAKQRAAAATTTTPRAPIVRPPPAPAAAPAPPAAPALDADLVADLLASGLSLAEVHLHLGLPPPPTPEAATAAPTAAAGGRPPTSKGGRGRGGRR